MLNNDRAPGENVHYVLMQAVHMNFDDELMMYKWEKNTTG